MQSQLSSLASITWHSLGPTTTKFFTTSVVFAQMNRFSLNLSSLQQIFSLWSNYFGTNTIVVKRVYCIHRRASFDGFYLVTVRFQIRLLNFLSIFCLFCCLTLLFFMYNLFVLFDMMFYQDFSWIEPVLSKA